MATSNKILTYTLTLATATTLAACGGGGGGGGGGSSYSAPAAPLTTSYKSTSVDANTALSRGYSNNNITIPAVYSSGSQDSTTTNRVNSYITSHYANNNTIFNQAGSGKTDEVNKNTYSENANVLIANGFSNVLSNASVARTNESNNKMYAATATTRGTGKDSKLSGNGVVVGMIDGTIITNNQYFQTTPKPVTYPQTEAEKKYKESLATATSAAASSSLAAEPSPSTSTTTKNGEVGSDGSHGTYVALTLAGKTGQNYPGLASNSKVSYIAMKEQETEVGKLLTAVANSMDNGAKPRIINNSFTLPDPKPNTSTASLRDSSTTSSGSSSGSSVNNSGTSTNAKGSEIGDKYTEVNVNNKEQTVSETLYNGFKEAVKSVTANKDTSPLLVLATGNYHYINYLKETVDPNYYPVKEDGNRRSATCTTNSVTAPRTATTGSTAESSSGTNSCTTPTTAAATPAGVTTATETTLSSTSSTVATRQASTSSGTTATIKTLSESEKTKLFDTNFGKPLDNGTALVKLLKEDKGAYADSIIAVTGYQLDLNEYQRKINKAVKDKVVAGTIDSTTEDELKTAAGVTNTTADDTKSYSLNTSSYIIHKNAMQCGEAMYSCLAASFIYNYPKDNNTPIPDSNSNNGTQNNNARLYGTSFATPQVSATAALILEQYPWMTAKQVKETLLTTARDVGAPGVDPVFGWGILNAGAALNGPGMFIYGDFEARLNRSGVTNGKGYNYYFNNNIGGSGGLRVYGKDNDFLYLTGKNTFTGDIYVDSGHLVLFDRKTAYGNDKLDTVNPEVNAKVYVNSNGNLHGRFAYFNKDVVINGTAVIANSSFRSNLTLNSGATLAVDLSTKGMVSVSNTATLNGNLRLINAGNYTLTSPDQSTNTQSFQVVVKAGNLKTNFNSVQVVDSALKTVTLVKKGNELLMNAQARTPTASALALSSAVAARQADSDIIAAGATNLDKLFSQADAQAKATTNTLASTTNNVAATTTATTGLSLASAENEADAPSVELATTSLTSTASPVVNALTNPVTRNTSLTLAEGESSSVSSTSVTSTPSTTTTTSTATAQPVATTSPPTTVASTTTALSEPAASAEPTGASEATTGVATATASTSNTATAVTKIAATIQNLNSEQQGLVTLSQGASGYATLQEVVGLANSQTLHNFISNYQRSMVLDNRGQYFDEIAKKERAGEYSYVNYQHNGATWNNRNTNITGKNTGNQFTAGYVTNLNNNDLGGIVTYSNGNLAENYQLASVNKVALNSGSYKTASVGIYANHNIRHELSPALKRDLRMYVSGAFLYSWNFFDTQRVVAPLNGTTFTANYKTKQANATLVTGVDYEASSKLRLGAFAGLSLINNQVKTINEVASDQDYQILALNLPAFNRYNLQGFVGLNALYHFKFHDFRMGFDLQANALKQLDGANGMVKHAAGNFVNSSFTTDFLTKLSLGYSIDLNDNFRVHLKGERQQSSNWKDTNVGVQLNVKFK